jgi:hypothetical protein
LSFLVPLALFGWIPVVIVLFAVLPAKSATAYAFAIGWCFLPIAGYSLPGLPDYTKTFATSIGALLGLATFHAHLFLKLRGSLLDIALAVFCLSPYLSSVTNGLGAYDGLSAVIDQVVTWGLPYFVGRVVYRSVEDISALALAIVYCGFLYVPLCLWEVRMSPQLHANFYGFHQHSFAQTVRFGGWRPTVFMQHGLQVSLWMGFCFLIVYIAWRAKMQLNRSIPMWLMVAILGGTLVLLKSFGALVLVMAGIGLYEFVRLTRIRSVYLLIPLLVAGYLLGRGSGAMTLESLVTLVQQNVNEDRAGSLQFRFDNENLLAAKARQQLLFGWGGWGRNRVFDENGKDLTVTDGLWIIIFGTQGMVGLISFYAMQLSGPIAVLTSIRFRSQHFSIALAIGCCIATVDTLPNAMPIPIIQVAVGAIVTRLRYRTQSKPDNQKYLTMDAVHDEAILTES